MNVHRSLTWLLAIGMVVAACGPAEATAAPTTSTVAPATSTSVAGDLDVIVVSDGEYPPDVMVTCPGGPGFPIGALDDIAAVGADDPDGIFAAVKPFLVSEEGAAWPQEGWQLLHESQRDAILVSSFGDDLAFMFLDREGDEWAWSGSAINGNPCELQFMLPPDLNTVEWRLDPAVPGPGPEATELHVLLTERECVSGQEIGDRLVGPRVVMTDAEVRLAFAAEPPPGHAFSCQGNPETPFTVELPGPLGDREIIEGMAIGINLEDYLP